MAEPLRIVFFGTPEFALPTLDALEGAGWPPAWVVTQPDRPAGRGRQLQVSPVGRWAESRGIPTLKPLKVRAPEVLDRISTLFPDGPPDVAVVVAFGQIFPQALLDLPRFGCINLHASLLPKYRGAAPIQAAIAAGETVTGNTTMQMEAGLDSGPILLQEELAIGPSETAGELFPRLAAAGGGLMVRTLERRVRGDLVPRPQDPALATYAPRLTRESGQVDWSLAAAEIGCRLRAYTPWPGLASVLRGRPVKLVKGGVLPEATGAAPGTVLGLREGRLAVAAGNGSVFGVELLQRPDKPARSAADFVNGERLVLDPASGERFGDD